MRPFLTFGFAFLLPALCIVIFGFGQWALASGDNVNVCRGKAIAVNLDGKLMQSNGRYKLIPFGYSRNLTFAVGGCPVEISSMGFTPHSSKFDNLAIALANATEVTVMLPKGNVIEREPTAVLIDGTSVYDRGDWLLDHLIVMVIILVVTGLLVWSLLDYLVQLIRYLYKRKQGAGG